jgi:hypothetical protein
VSIAVLLFSETFGQATLPRPCGTSASGCPVYPRSFGINSKATAI